MTTTVHKAAYVARITGLGKSFGDRVVLDGIDLGISRGEVVALVGRSGSGKSTLLRILAGLSKADSGRLDVDGHPTLAFPEPALSERTAAARWSVPIRASEPARPTSGTTGIGAAAPGAAVGADWGTASTSRWLTLPNLRRR